MSAEALAALEVIDRLNKRVYDAIREGRPLDAVPLLQAIAEVVQVRMATDVKAIAMSDGIATRAREQVAAIVAAIGPLKVDADGYNLDPTGCDCGKGACCPLWNAEWRAFYKVSTEAEMDAIAGSRT